MIIRRILAFLIDLSLALFLSETGIYLLKREILAGTDPDDLFNPFRNWALASFHPGSLAIGLFFYFFLFLAINSETPGFSVFGLSVIREAEDGDQGKIGVRRALARTVALLVSLMTLGLGFCMVLLNDRRRALHDCLSGTRVVRQKSASPA